MCFENNWHSLPFWGSRFFSGGIIMMILFTILTILAIIFLVSYLKKGSSSKIDEALEILKKKYVNGEITKKEFEEKKKVLT